MIAETRIAQTPLGDETLALAAEDMLSCSVGYAAGLKDQKLDRNTMTRRIHRAYLDHLSFVEDPAYEDAKVLSVRQGTMSVEEVKAMEEPFRTPNLDDFTDDEIFRWVAERLKNK